MEMTCKIKTTKKPQSKSKKKSALKDSRNSKLSNKSSFKISPNNKIAGWLNLNFRQRPL